MATIKRARNYLIYLLAIFISVLFSWVGRSTPLWASEIKSTHAAKVFNDEVYRVAAADENTTSTTGAKTFLGTFQPVSQVRLNYRLNEMQAGALQPYQTTINQQIERNLNDVKVKIDAGKDLDAAEVNLIVGTENAYRLSNIINQYNVLIDMIQRMVENKK